ncbi:DUF3089 domain-containing protein [Novosphingobium sp. AAP93]|uniref:DUF3089 domain-containing protein n=1 Tax=Novosphingobium sp. AAP93 TaxID=1523427 RepID=UPI0006B9FDF4|nr:DUF3089 domain-containing protein [Novosphingobium sp. AAP93]KPF89846.1 hypothetical protein IP83_00680 [Novosphingobium sp. AAP93]
MARKFLYFVALLIVMAIAALFALRIWSAELTRFAFVPRGAFETQPALRAGVYEDPAMWVSRPGTVDDPAQYRPEGMPAAPQGKAYVFFIHPTSYLAREHWNGPIDDKDTRNRTALFVRGMASAFNGEAAVFVPYYRQAAFGSFLVNRPETLKARAVAYGDVRAAFRAFVAAIPADAPIVLAGHSQGALHVMHLLKDDVKGTPLAARIVAAYMVGWPISPLADLPQTGLRPCTAPEQTGCAMSWLSFADPPDARLMLDTYRAEPGLDGMAKGPEPILCTNPLTGGSAPSAPGSANLGTMVPSQDLASGKLEKRGIPARCDERSGLLMIGEPPDLGPYVLPGNNYHVYDVPLFWANVRADVARRSEAWLAQHRNARPGPAR